MKDLIDQVKNAKDTKATQDATNAVSLENLKFEKLKFQYEMYRDKQRSCRIQDEDVGGCIPKETVGCSQCGYTNC